MNHYPEPILKLIHSFSKLPGIGNKTGERLVLHLLHASKNDAQTLAYNILELKKTVTLCSVCFALTDKDLCKICSDPSRDQNIICVVEKPSDMAAIEKSNAFKGTYHILGSALSPLDGIGPDDIRIKELVRRTRSKKIKEIIIATGTDVEGESTASYLMDILKPAGIQLSRIASGIPMGGDLQYVDQLTMQKAMEKRYGC